MSGVLNLYVAHVSEQVPSVLQCIVRFVGYIYASGRSAGSTHPHKHEREQGCGKDPPVRQRRREEHLKMTTSIVMYQAFVSIFFTIIFAYAGGSDVVLDAK